MGIFSATKFDNFEDLFIHQIEDLYDAERQLTEALPQMESSATSPQLKSAFRAHLAETKNHANRLEQVMRMLGRQHSGVSCAAMKGLIKEGEEVSKAKGNPAIKDAALIAAAQRVEHYEISGYGTARTFAQRIGREDAAKLLQQTLDEEKVADQKLTNIAEESVNAQAVHV
jgi:ferritin-like metal-binding protein YciE